MEIFSFIYSILTWGVDPNVIMAIDLFTLIAGGSALLGGVLGADATKDAADAQIAASERAAQIINDVDLPDVEKMRLLLEEYQQVGEYNPEMQQALEQEASAFEAIQSDPMLAQQQEQALQQMSEIADGGLTEADAAAARDIQRQVAASDTARRKAVLNNMAQRGVLGSGMELAAQLQGIQESTDQQAAASDALTREAMARSLQAIQSSANMAGNMRSQDFGEQSSVAQARDAINRFNTQNQQQVANQNVNNVNQAQLTNLQAQQGIANQNTNLRNQQQMHNTQLDQTRFNNEMQRANAAAGNQMAIGQAEANAGNAMAGVIGSAASGLTNLFGSMANNDDKK